MRSKIHQLFVIPVVGFAALVTACGADVGTEDEVGVVDQAIDTIPLPESPASRVTAGTWRTPEQPTVDRSTVAIDSIPFPEREASTVAIGTWPQPEEETLQVGTWPTPEEGVVTGDGGDIDPLPQ